MHYIFIIVKILALLFFIFFSISAIISFREKEQRATLIFLILAFFIPAIYLLSYFLTAGIEGYYALILLLLTLIGGMLLGFPFRGKLTDLPETPNHQNDERNTMFSRRELIPGDKKYADYYKVNPTKKELDDKFRQKPGLLAPKSSAYDPVIFAAANASFYTVAAYRDFIDDTPSSQKIQVNKSDITSYIKNWAIKLGAVDAGVTLLRPYHLYSVKGRREKYGKLVVNHHKYAIAFTVEMDKNNIDAAPKAPTVLESAQQYLNSGTIAVQIAQFIRELGYSAKAHIDGNYEVVCPLVARDAGMGEIGRMGLLMTPKLGPRVRISVITTDLPLELSERKKDNTLFHFCKICKKCAANCPSQSISFKNRQNINGAYRWQINSEACYTYWCIAGTDCGKCIKVCPYAHPNNVLHNMVRWGIRNNLLFRHLALYLDDVFYGRKPVTKKIPAWMSVRTLSQ